MSHSNFTETNAKLLGEYKVWPMLNILWQILLSYHSIQLVPVDFSVIAKQKYKIISIQMHWDVVTGFHFITSLVFVAGK